MKVVITDGGREAAGFKGKTGDCVVRAIAIITQKPYAEVYDALHEMAKTVKYVSACKKKWKPTPRTGVDRKVYEKYLLSLGYKWTPTMLVGQGCKVHLVGGELPMGKLIVRVSKHVTAVIDGVIHDTYDPCREVHETEYIGGVPHTKIINRCVYGYYKKEIQIKTDVISSAWVNFMSILLTNSFSIIGTIMGMKTISDNKKQ